MISVQSGSVGLWEPLPEAVCIGSQHFDYSDCDPCLMEVLAAYDEHTEAFAASMSPCQMYGVATQTSPRCSEGLLVYALAQLMWPRRRLVQECCLLVVCRVLPRMIFVRCPLVLLCRKRGDCQPLGSDLMVTIGLAMGSRRVIAGIF